MSFTSYAQNFEDVMLWRALGHLEHGFYIDIGAQDPVTDSVSLAFYQHGWRGVHVEPTAQYSRALREARPDEDVLQVAIGPGRGPMAFYEFEGTGLSTGDPSIAASHQAQGYGAVETAVAVLSMDALLDRYGNRPVHWLKLDVEGFEKGVLESWRESPVRPWILVVESTLPMSHVASHDEWEGLVLAKGYSFAWFDGLNRFYVHSDHLDLKSSFDRPPNVFDGFALAGTASHTFWKRPPELARLEDDLRRLGQQLVLAEEAAKIAGRAAQQEKADADRARIALQQAEQDLNGAKIDLRQARATAQEALARAGQSNEEAQRVQQALIAVHASHSWRLTAPIRWVTGNARQLPDLWRVHARQALTTNAKRGIRWSTRFLSRNPKLLLLAKRTAVALPPLERLLRRAFTAAFTPAAPSPARIEHESPAAPRLNDAQTRVLLDLRDATDLHDSP